MITADFGVLIRVTEVIFKKFDHSNLSSFIVMKFKLELKSDEEWLLHGEFETGMKEKDYLY